jgi:chemotaxis protein MotB
MSRVLPALFLLSVFLGGCVPLSMHGALREAFDKLEAENKAVKKELAQATAESKRLQQEAASLKAANEALTRQAKDLAANLQQLNRDKAGLADQTASAMAALAAKEAEKTALAVKAEEQAIALRRMEALKAPPPAAAPAAKEAGKPALAAKGEEQAVAFRRLEALMVPPLAAEPPKEKPPGTLDAALRDEMANGNGSIRRGEGVVTIELMEPALYYNSASATIRPEGLKVLKRIADVLKDGTDKEIRVEAHTDVMIQTTRFPSTMDLSVARANGVLRFLKTQSVAGPARISAVGYAEAQPAMAGDSAQSPIRNRRVEIIVRSK